MLSSLWIGIVAWNGMQSNGTDLFEAHGLEKALLELHRLMLVQADASKAMILYPDDSSSGIMKIAAFDAHNALLGSLVRQTKGRPELLGLHGRINRLGVVDEESLRPADMEIVEALAAENTNQARLIYRTRYYPARARYERILGEATAEAKLVAQAAAGGAIAKNSRSLQMIGLALVCGIGFTMTGLVWLLRHRVIEPLRQIRKIALAAAIGESAVASGKTDGTEVGRTVAVVHRLHAFTCEMFGMLAAEAIQLKEQCVHFQGVSDSLADGVDHAADRSCSISAARDEMAQSIREASEYLTSISSSIEGLAGNAQESARMAAIAQSLSHNTHSAVSRLKRSTAAIDEIAEMIARVAFETNILALNAAIEATHYGDAGAGFGVIARQIKILAEKSKSATEQISVHVAHVGTDVKETVSGIEEITQILDRMAAIADEVAIEVKGQIKVTRDLDQSVAMLAGSSHGIAESLQQMVMAVDGAHHDANRARELAGAVGATSSHLGKVLQGLIAPAAT